MHRVATNLIKSNFLQKRFGALLQNGVCSPFSDQRPIQHANQRSCLSSKSPRFPQPEDKGAERDYALTYTEIINYLSKPEACPILGEAQARLTSILEHIMPLGRKFETIGLVDTYKLMESAQNRTPINIKLAYVLSCCIALQTATYMIEDDIIDGDELRGGVPCWHTLPGNELLSINDSYLIQTAIFIILKKYFSDHANYLPILELLNKTNYKMSLGHSIDLACTVDGYPRFEEFTKHRYNFLAENMSSNFTYELPIKLAMLIADMDYTKYDAKIRNLTSKIGLLSLVHNNIQDCFYKSEISGKNKSDICIGRCTWLAVEALQRGTYEQKQIFMKHYGKPSGESETVVRDLYKKLNLSRVFEEFRNDIITEVSKEAELISDDVPKQVFLNFLTEENLNKQGQCY